MFFLGLAADSLRVEYNSKDKVTRYTDPVGRQTTYCYDTNEIDLLEVRQTTGRPDTDPDACTGAPGAGINELLASASYDTQHQRVTSTDAAGQTSTRTYTPTGRLETEVSAPRAGPDSNPLSLAERTTSYEYYPIGAPNGEGRLKRITSPSSPQGSTTDDYSYDVIGRLETTTDTDGHTTTREYDDLDRVTKLIYPDGTFDETQYERLDAVRARDRLGRWTHTFYDPFRRIVAQRDPANRTATLDWCRCGALEALTDPNGNATRWERDIQGRVTKEIRADGSTKETFYESTTSRLKSVLDAKLQTTTREYYLDNRLKDVLYTNSEHPTADVSFSYEPNYARLATRLDGTGTTTYSYHPIAAPPSLGAGALASIDGPLPNDTIEYGYDELARAVTRTINPTTHSQVYDSLHRIVSETNALGAFTYDYVGATARLATITYPSGQTTAYDYLDNLGDRRLREIHNKLPGGATLSRFEYATLANGRVQAWTQQGDSDPSQVYELVYDPADRLTGATLKTKLPAPTITGSYGYQYDEAGNRTIEAVDDFVTTTDHDEVNRLLDLQPGGALRFAGNVDEPTAVTIGGQPAQVGSDNRFSGSAPVVPGNNSVTVQATDSAGNVRTNIYDVSVSGASETFGYDANGNLTSDGTRAFEWDAENRLITVTQGTLRSELTYDGVGKRVRILEKNGATVTSDQRFLWCGLRLCDERDGAGAVTRRFFSRGTEQGGSAYFFSKDHLGSIREVTDSTGAMRARYAYDPFGRITKVSGDLDSSFGFTGHFEHGPSGLTLAPFRAYDASLGRWISEDPIGLAGGDLNLSSYVGNDPVNLVDPTGRFGVTSALGGAAALGVTAADVGAFVASALVIMAVLVEGIPPDPEPFTPENDESPPAEAGEGETTPPQPEPVKVPGWPEVEPADEKCENDGEDDECAKVRAECMFRARAKNSGKNPLVRASYIFQDYFACVDIMGKGKCDPKPIPR